MELNTVEELVEDIRQGKMVILMDDEDRENEGDLVIAAEQVRPEDINFMATHARGLICLTLTRERCDFLGLPPMSHANNAQFQTNFTVSIEAAEGVTTGISAADRAHTIRVAVGRNTKPKEIVQPGHIFPIAAQPGGVLSRAGHTEAGCDLARMAGFEPAAAIVEIMNEDGSMARRPDLEIFAKQTKEGSDRTVERVFFLFFFFFNTQYAQRADSKISLAQATIVSAVGITSRVDPISNPFCCISFNVS